MKATLHFSNQQTVVIDGAKSLEHAEEIAHVIASRFSASYGKPVYAQTIQIDSNNFICLTYDDYVMEGVTVISSVGGK